MKTEDLILHQTKTIINAITPQIIQLIPPIEEKQPISQIVHRIFKEVKKNLAGHPKRFYQDGNFPRFLDALEKAIIFIAETDGHYRGWLAYFLLATMDIMNYEYEKFPYKRYFKKWKIKGLKLKDPHTKPLLFLQYLTQHGIKAKIKRIP